MVGVAELSGESEEIDLTENIGGMSGGPVVRMVPTRERLDDLRRGDIELVGIIYEVTTSRWAVSWLGTSDTSTPTALSAGFERLTLPLLQPASGAFSLRANSLGCLFSPCHRGVQLRRGRRNRRGHHADSAIKMVRSVIRSSLVCATTSRPTQSRSRLSRCRQRMSHRYISSRCLARSSNSLYVTTLTQGRSSSICRLVKSLMLKWLPMGDVLIFL
jgi:hypothetical protein